MRNDFAKSFLVRIRWIVWLHGLLRSLNIPDLFELYKKQTLMRTSDHSFLISVYYVGLQLFLIFFLHQLWLQAFPPFCFPD